MGRLTLASVGLLRWVGWGGPGLVLPSPYTAPRLALATVPGLAGGTAAGSATGTVPSSTPGPVTWGGPSS